MLWLGSVFTTPGPRTMDVWRYWQQRLCRLSLRCKNSAKIHILFWCVVVFYYLLLQVSATCLLHDVWISLSLKSTSILQCAGMKGVCHKTTPNVVYLWYFFVFFEICLSWGMVTTLRHVHQCTVGQNFFFQFVPSFSKVWDSQVSLYRSRSWSWFINIDWNTDFQTLWQFPVWFYMDMSTFWMACYLTHNDAKVVWKYKNKFLSFTVHEAVPHG